LAEFMIRMKRLHDVGSENAIYVGLVDRVRLDLAETDRLLHLPEVKFSLSKSPEKVAWIRKTITSVRIAIEQMGKYTGRVSADLERGKHVKLRHRIRWVLDEHEKLAHRQMLLAASHQGLLEVLGFLTTLEPLACCIEEAKPKPRPQPQQRIQQQKVVAFQDFEGPRRKPMPVRRGPVRDEIVYDREVDVSRVNRGGFNRGDDVAQYSVRKEVVTSGGNRTYRERTERREFDRQDNGASPPLRTHWPQGRL